MHLKTIISGVISDIQSAYVESRNILDAPMVISELHTWAKKLKKKSFCLRLISIKYFTP